MFIYRPPINIGKITEIEHVDTKNIKDMKNSLKWELKNEHKNTWEKNGLSNLKYKIKKKISKKYYKIIKVEL